ncbi:MAG TPA: transposase [Chitinophagaceae bacterium]|nr:transposase [Chitinophagaceae bacterium]
MKEEYLHYPANYFTATINEWKPVLANDNYKDIIIGSLQNLVSKNRIELNAFVIMNNHIHLIWQPLQSFTPTQNQASFMKFTARQLLLSLVEDDKDLHASFKVNKYDRDYQVWKREPLSIELPNKKMFIQKLEYIHYNPVRAGLCEVPEDYHYSSARFYIDGTNDFGMLKHFSD